MPDLLFAALSLGWFCLAVAGAGLVVAVVFAYLAPPAPIAAGVDARRVRAGRRRAVRRCAAGWFVSAAVWLAAVQVLRLTLGT